MSNSSLVSYTKISPNRTTPRNHVIDTITIHCVVGQLSVETMGNMFAKSSFEASCNYCIGSDGRIGLIVEEKDRSWCTSSRSNDHRAITIEVASDTYHPYAVNDLAYQSLIILLVDICQRNNIKQLLWQGDKNLIGQTDKQNMTVHRWFANKSCPGDYLYNRHGEIAAAVNACLLPPPEPPKEENKEVTQEQFNQMMNVYLEQLAQLPPDSWSEKDRLFCEQNNIIRGDEKGNKMYKKFVTREELAAIIHRAVK